MNEQERLQKDARCDLLMKEGIDGPQEVDAVILMAMLTDLAMELGRKDGLACALAWCEALEQKGIPGELAILVDYNRANAIAGQRYGTEWQWDQPTLARELFYLRRAVSHEKCRDSRHHQVHVPQQYWQPNVCRWAGHRSSGVLASRARSAAKLRDGTVQPGQSHC